VRREYLVLELLGVAGVDRDHGAVDVQLADHRGGAADEFLAEGFAGELAEPEEADEDVLVRVFVAEEGLPASVGVVVSADEFDLVWPDLGVDVFDADFSGAHVSAGDVHVAHLLEGEFADVAVVDACGHQRHGDVSLDAVHADPRRHQREHLRDDLDQVVRVVVLVLAVLPELVEAGASDDERGVDLEAVGAEVGVFEELLEAFEVALDAHVRQVGHHVGDDFVPAVLAHFEALLDGLDGVASVGVASDVFVDALHADLDASAAVGEHVSEVRLVAEVRPGLDGDSDALRFALF